MCCDRYCRHPPQSLSLPVHPTPASDLHLRPTLEHDLGGCESATTPDGSFHLDPVRLDAFLVQLSLPAGSRCPAWPQALPKGRTRSTDHMVLSPCQLLLRESPEERHRQQVARSAPVHTQLQNGHMPLGALPGFTELRPSWHLGESVWHIEGAQGHQRLSPVPLDTKLRQRLPSATGYKVTAVIHSNFQTPDYYSGFRSDAPRAQCLSFTISHREEGT